MLLLVVVNVSGLYAGLARNTLLSQLALSVSWWLLIAWHSGWTVFWLVAAWQVWHQREQGRLLVLYSFPLYQALNLLAQAVLARGAYERGRLPFAAAWAIWTAAAAIWALNRPAVRQAFHNTSESTDQHVHTSQNR